MSILRWFIPHRANDYHPHLLRPLGLLLVVMTLLGINITQNIASANSWQVLGIATNVNADSVMSLSNQERINNGLSVLGYNPQLASAAQAKAQDMFAKDYWAHNAPDGTTPWTFITNAGYAYITAGENLAKDFDTSAGVVAGWMNSTGHRANILNGAFTETGVAVMNGTLLGSPTTLVVAMYAAPKAIAAATPAPTPPVAAKTVPAPAPSPSPAAVVPAETPAAAQVSGQPAAAVAAEPKTPPPLKADMTPEPQIIDSAAVSYREKRTWAQNATLFVLSTLFLVSVLKHTVIWRTRKNGRRHVWLRGHPAMQYILLMVAIAANLMSGIGVMK